jgi:histidine ammonia-lyase
MKQILGAEDLDLLSLYEFFHSGDELKFTAADKKRVEKSRTSLEQYIQKLNKPIYGINTGFGALHDTSIDDDKLGQLQKNLVMSHACGTGPEIDPELVRLMLLLKARALAYGHSGAQVETVERLVTFYNKKIIPLVYEQGSLGASGDLAPLAHLSLPLLGMGQVRVKGIETRGSELEGVFGLKPIELKSKEGLALLNGTQFMLAHGIWSCWHAEELFQKANQIAALSLDAYDGKLEPFHPRLHEIRKQPGQLRVANRISELLKGSQIISQHKKHTQDPYSFRCIPQVHGAVSDVLVQVQETFTRELNSVTDNPTYFPDDELILSGGNFHGEALAMAMDFLAIALSELGSISERRIYKMISGDRGLPRFLVANPGLNSGFMIPQYTAASIASQNKQLSHPASVDTIDSSAGQEDHVSMGANAATKLKKVVENVQTILSIELFVAAQAFDFRRPLKSSKAVEELHDKFRRQVKFVQEDIEMHRAMKASRTFLFPSK